MKIYVESISKDVEEDNYEEGALPGTRQTVLHEEIGEIVDGLGGIVEIAGRYGATDDLRGWGIMDGESGRILIQQQEDEDGDCVTTKDRKWSEFKKGKINLWIADYDIYVKFVNKMWDPSSDELIEALGIQGL